MISLQATNELYVKSGGLWQQQDLYVLSASTFVSAWPVGGGEPPAPSEDPIFRMVVDTDGVAPQTATGLGFTIICGNTGSYNAEIDWGDTNTSTITTYNDADLAHTYGSAGEYNITISGSLPWFNLNNNSANRFKWRTINNWGDLGYISMKQAFTFARNLRFYATDSLDLQGDCTSCFSLCDEAHTWEVANWNFEGVTNATSMFQSSTLNGDVFTGKRWPKATNFSLMLNAAAGYQFSLEDLPVHQCAGAGVNNGVYGIADGVDINVTAQDNYDATLISWRDQLDASGSVGAQLPYFDSQYSAGAAATARSELISTYGWTFNDLGQA